ncbi:MAG: tRNA lysidine(34) synthetase TilS [Nitrosomonadales bacterium]|jgi:tRNA(Ile)-lysidine synthase|nr:MAG: tRNA lysidine(34) synthetase TilS [Nitrosomonadales bacterium]
MANSRKLKLSNIFSRVENILHEQIQRDDHLVLGLSGGVDSVVLLNILTSLSLQLEFALSAFHVNHGISPNANKWERFCLNLCGVHGIPIKIAKLKIGRLPGASLEAIARDARYQRFKNLKADYVILAQHLDDQAETLLLQMLRGAGVKGLGAMPVVRNQISKIGNQALDPGPQILRPLLNVSRSEIEDYSRKHKLCWIADESNNDVSFDRNFLRHKIFPLLEKRFPSYRTTFLRTSRHMAEASCLLDDLAEYDRKECAISNKLQIERLRELSFSRARNLLRYNLAQQGVTLPSTVKLEDILRQLVSSRLDSKLHITFGDTEIRSFKGNIYVRRVSALPNKEWKFVWKGEKQLAIAELGGSVRFIRKKGKGINLQKLKEGPVIIRFRLGGERIRPDCNRPRRSLKNLLQEASFPLWERESLPLLFSGDCLVWVPGVGVDCSFQAGVADPGLIVSWHPNAS